MNDQLPHAGEQGLCDTQTRLASAEVLTGEAEDTPDGFPESGQAGRTESRMRPEVVPHSEQRSSDQRSCEDTIGFLPLQHSTSHAKLDLKRAFSRRRQYLTALRRNTVTGRVRVMQERGICLRQHEHTLEAAKRWMEAAEGITGTLDRSEWQAPLQSLCEQMYESFVRLDTYTKSVTRLEEELYKLELHLSETEARFYEDYVKPLCGDDSSSTDDEEYCMISRSEASTEEIHPLLQRYYDKAGDIGVFKDRLNELEFHHQQEMFMRNERMGLGEPISPSEQTFQESYFIERSNTIRDLSEAQAETRRLREECLRNSLTPEDFHEIDGPQAPQDHSCTMVNPLSNACGDKAFDRIKPIELIFYGITSTYDRILQWLDLVAPNSAQKVAREGEGPRNDSSGRVSDASSSQRLSLCHAEAGVDKSSNTTADAKNITLDPSEPELMLRTGLRRRHSDSGSTIGQFSRLLGSSRLKARSNSSGKIVAGR